MIANLANVPASPQSLLVWSFSHAAHHRDINRRIYELAKIALPEFIIDPFNPDDFDLWGLQHQQLHNNQNAVLNISGNDLTDVNWKDLDERATWIWLNFQEHYQAANILRV